MGPTFVEVLNKRHVAAHRTPGLGSRDSKGGPCTRKEGHTQLSKQSLEPLQKEYFWKNNNNKKDPSSVCSPVQLTVDTIDTNTVQRRKRPFHAVYHLALASAFFWNNVNGHP